jgi:hypothetical protein
VTDIPQIGEDSDSVYELRRLDKTVRKVDLPLLYSKPEAEGDMAIILKAFSKTIHQFQMPANKGSRVEKGNVNEMEC